MGSEHPPELVFEGTFRAASSRSGGHGNGDAIKREPKAVVLDVRNEIISHWTAMNVYHVEYDDVTWTVDEAKTVESRKKELESRLQRSTSYSEFEKEWMKKKPPKDILTYYGSWPDAKETP